MAPKSDRQIQSLLTSSDRLHKIDQLREHNIGAHLPLPQLVAVGDQSSGKSSLLESLSGFPFPRGQELCTRYATQITHRRGPDSHLTITVIPGPEASQELKEKLGKFKSKAETADKLRNKLPEILQEVRLYANKYRTPISDVLQVNCLLDIRTPANPKGENTFSEAILKIEKAGPDENNLTIIDVPGIFRTTTEGITTKKDQEIVKNMVKRYIKDRLTIILAVLPSNVDVATQEILSFAEEADPEGDRTLGILTKADLLTEKSAKDAVMSLVQGKRKVLKLGYHVITNRGGDDLGEEPDPRASQLDREAMFEENPWCHLRDNRVGADSLRKRLGDLLGDLTDRAFPKVRTQIRRKLAHAERRLARHGAPRQTEREQQQYLAKLASAFQSLVRAGLNADYSSNRAFEKPELRLITAIMNTTDAFNLDFGSLAHTYLFDADNETPQVASGRSKSNEPLPQNGNSKAKQDRQLTESDVSDTDSDMESLYGNKLDDMQTRREYHDLHSIIKKPAHMEPPKKGIMEWIENVYQQARGRDLGSFNSNFLSNVFREQSVKWQPMAEQYVSKVIVLINNFITTALVTVCLDKTVCHKISSAIVNETLSKYQKGISQVIQLVSIEREMQPYTLNHYFNQNQQKALGTRTRETLLPRAGEGQLYDNKKCCWQTVSSVVDLNVVEEVVTKKSNVEYSREKIHDVLNAYYKIASQRFVDNVFNQVVDYILLSGPDSPLGLFSDEWVLGLDSERLGAMVGEARWIREERHALQKKIADLSLAMRILQ